MGEPFDIICFSHQWDKFRRRYRSMMLELAKREEVGRILFVETPPSLTSLIRFFLGRTDQYTSERWRRIFSKGLVIQEGKVCAVTPLALVPFDRMEALQWLSVPFINLTRRWLIRGFLRKHSLRNTVLWITHPYHSSGFVGRYGERVLCYDLCDDYTEFFAIGSLLRKTFEAEDRRLTAAADLMFVSSGDLERKKKATGKAVYRLSNAVDYDYFRQLWEEAQEPADLAPLKRPRLGYLGKITHRTDLSMVGYAARSHPEWSVAMIGPISPHTDGVDELRTLPNVAFLGEKPYSDVPAYLKYVDVCIMPHKINPLTESMDPLKLYSYLASGRPIVSTGVAGIELFPDVVRIADDKEAFVAQIEAALRGDDSQLEARQLAVARENSWSARVEAVFGLIQAKLRERARQDTGAPV